MRSLDWFKLSFTASVSVVISVVDLNCPIPELAVLALEILSLAEAILFLRLLKLIFADVVSETCSSADCS